MSPKPHEDAQAPTDPRMPTGTGCGRSFAVLLCLVVPTWLRGNSLTIPTTFGDLQIPLFHVDAGGSTLRPGALSIPPFAAPTIFSAPLPSGSGARALGLAGAFTAVADDATAASWNPAGLTQLERPEVSVVYRFKHERQAHASDRDDYRVGRDEVGEDALNYWSAVLPFRLFQRNAVVSLNLQEVYDFSQEFHAAFAGRESSRQGRSLAASSGQTLFHHFDFPNGFIDVTETLVTQQTTTMDQRTSSETAGDLRFTQSGTVQALTPALAVDLTPKVSLGGALNVYQGDLFGSDAIRSRTRATYSGTLRSNTSITDRRETSGTWSYTGTYVNPGPFPVIIPLDPGSGDIPVFTDTETRHETTVLRYSGMYEAVDTTEDLFGVNATLGGLWTANRHLTLGGCLDLPWTAEARQTQTIRAESEAGDGRMRSSTFSETTKDVEFTFPLYWSLSAAWRWNNRLTSSVDLSQTQWSRYAFQAEGEAKINPLDGSPHGEHPIDDCWALRTGTEYLWVLSNTEIPLRAGLSWEQRPAIGTPDDYWGVSLGSGFSIGRGPRRVIVDVAYLFSWGSDVMETLVPGQQGALETDVQRHDLYLSCICHF